MAALTKNQQRFRDAFAAETGLNRRFVGAWMLAEQSGSAAKNYDSRGYNNWLNIGNTDSLVARGGSFESKVWSDPEKAAQASAEWMRGRGDLAKSYGRPAAGITKILGTAGKGPEASIKALSSSGWASSGYNGGSVLRQLMGLEQGGAKSTAGDGRTSRASGVAKAVEPRTRTVTETRDEFDDEGYERVRRQAALKGVLKQSGGMKMLAGLLPDAADPAQFTRTVESTRTETVPGAPKATVQRTGGTGGGAAGIPGLKGKGSGLFELFHQQDAYKHGARIGAVPHHDGHVHAAAGPKTVIGLGKLAEKFGLTVRENPHWDPVDPVHVDGSYHYKKQAIDVSGDAKAMRRYTERVKKIFGLK